MLMRSMVSASTSSIAIASALRSTMRASRSRSSADQLLGVAQAGNAASFGENHRRRYHWPEERATADLVDAGNHLGAGSAGGPLVAASAHQRLAACASCVPPRKVPAPALPALSGARSGVRVSTQASPKSSVDHFDKCPSRLARVSHSCQQKCGTYEATPRQRWLPGRVLR